MKKVNRIMSIKRIIPFLSTILLVTTFLITGTVSFAQENQSPSVYMTALDYEAFHTQLINLCASRFPETAQTLRTAIAQWNKKNLPALKEIRALLREEMIDQGIPEKEADTRNSQAVAQMTQFMTGNIAKIPDSELGPTCSGKYAEMLGSPNMDYVVFFEQLKAEFEKGKPAITKKQEERQIIRLIDEKKQGEGLVSVAWSPDGKSIATSGKDKQVIIWNAATLSIRHQLKQDYNSLEVDKITFSPDSQYVALGLRAINVWKVSDGTLHTTLIVPNIIPSAWQVDEIKSLRFSPDGKLLVVAYKGERAIVIAYRIADGEFVWSYEPKRALEPQRRGSPGFTTPLVFTPDGKSVILGTEEYGSEDVNLRRLARILVLDAASGKFLRSIDDIHVMAPEALALSPDGKLLATSTSTGFKSQTNNFKKKQTVTIDNKDPVRIWNLETGKLVRELPVNSFVKSIVFSRDGKYLFGAKIDNETHLTLAVWDVASGKMVQMIRNNPGPWSLAISPDGKRLAAACERRLSIYEIMTSK